MPERKDPLHSTAASWADHIRQVRAHRARRHRRYTFAASGMIIAGGLGLVAWCVTLLGRSLGLQ